jgi:hypothetical protein
MKETFFSKIYFDTQSRGAKGSNVPVVSTSQFVTSYMLLLWLLGNISLLFQWLHPMTKRMCQILRKQSNVVLWTPYDLHSNV